MDFNVELLEITKDNLNEAQFMAGNFIDKSVKNRIFLNVVGAEAVITHLEKFGFNVENISSIHSIKRVIEKIDIADVILNNIHIDVRVIFKDDLVFVPKSHYKFDIVPDIYVVLKYDKSVQRITFLGFFEPSEINPNNCNKDYYFVDPSKLRNPFELTHFISNFHNKTEKALTDAQMLRGRELSVTVADHDVTDEEFKEFLGLMLKSSELRASVLEYDNFETLASRVAFALQIKQPKHALDTGVVGIDEFMTLDDFNNDETSGVVPNNTDLNGDDLLDDDIVSPAENFVENAAADSNVVGEVVPDVTEDSDLEFSTSDIANDEGNGQDEVVSYQNMEEIMAEPEKAVDLEEGSDSDSEDLIISDNSAANEEIHATNDYSDVMDNFMKEDDFEFAESDLDFSNFESDMDGLVLNDVNDVDNPELYDVNTDDTDRAEDAADNFVENIGLTEDDKSVDVSDVSAYETLEDTENDIFDETDPSVTSAEDLQQVETDKENSNVENSHKIEKAGEYEENLLSFPDESSQSNSENEPVNFNDEDNLFNLPKYDSGNFESETSEIEASEDDNSLIYNFSDIENGDAEKEESTVLPADNEPEINDEVQEQNDLENDSEPDQQDNDSLLNSFEISEMPMESPDSNANAEVHFDEFEDFESFETVFPEEQNVDVDFTDDNLASELPLKGDTKENSVVISNKNLVPGEIFIDINADESRSGNYGDNEHIEELYSSSNYGMNDSGLNNDVRIVPGKANNTPIILGIGGLALVVIILGIIAFSVYKFVTPAKQQDKTAQASENKAESKLGTDVPNLPNEDNDIIMQDDVQREGRHGSLDPNAMQVQNNQKISGAKQIPSTSFLSIKKLSWEVPDYVSYDPNFKQYFQSSGKSLKAALTSDLLMASDYTYSDQIKVSILFDNSGNFKNAKILLSSGSSQVDNIVLQSVNQTLKVLKAPNSLGKDESTTVILKIYL